MITSESIVEYAINYELTAQWKINDVTVYLDYNFDFGPQAVNAKKNPTSVEIPTLIELNDSRDMMVLEYDSLYGVLPLPERDGYTFAGWYFEEDADGNGCGEQACLLNSTCTRVTNT